MDRRSQIVRLRYVIPCLLVAWLSTCVGCSMVSALAWAVTGGMVDGKYNDLMKNKKVAVVARSVSSEQFVNASVPKDLARAVHSRLGTNVKKVQMVSQQRIDDWIDNNTYSDFVEVGQAVGADLVLGLDIEYFTIQSNKNQLLYQGESSIRFEVVDCRTGKVVANEQLRSDPFPRTPRPAMEQNRVDFTRQYVGFLADRVGAFFYPTDPRKHFASDANSTPY